MIIDSLLPLTLSGLTLFVAMACADAETSGQDTFHAMRERMVETQIVAREVRTESVVQAMRRVPRHLFVADDLRPFAYDDRPLSIGRGQTISQPYIVAYMTEALQLAPAHTVLEIGTGSGYQSAVLAEIVKQVYSTEIIPDLAERALRALAEAGIRNVEVRTANGYFGWPEHAPFDRIIVTAAPPEIPQALVDQLAIGGMMVVPVGTSHQEIVVVTKTPGGAAQKRTIEVRFVPMVSKPGD
jgi:protein-L-isoaspartate(D-aspartate) O-methyltransferase